LPSLYYGGRPSTWPERPFAPNFKLIRYRSLGQQGASLSSRMDRLDRIEQRLDLVEA
jgi:hypothetical protein